MTIDELIARLEAATEASGELDAEVGRYGASEFLGYIPDELQWGCYAYTSSVDKAVLLLPPHTLWAAGRMEDGPFVRVCLPQPGGGYAGGYMEVFAATVPLAICIAALKAKGAPNE